MDRIEIPLSNGYKLIAERNGGEFDKEIYVGIEDPSGLYIQDLTIIRPTYHFENADVLFDADKFEILVFGDADKEAYTEKLTVPLYQDE